MFSGKNNGYDLILLFKYKFISVCILSFGYEIFMLCSEWYKNAMINISWFLGYCIFDM